jgi:serine/threonine protein kinase
MDFIHGMSLHSYIKTKCVGRVIPENLCREYFREIAGAFHYLHSHHISHRDIKLDNILIEERTNKIKIIDFGFAAFT